MGIAKLYGQKASGTNINGIIKDYHAYAGENISAGDLVEYINGIASTETETSVDTKLSATSKAGECFSAVKLDENRVFVAHKYGSDEYLYGVVAKIVDATITVGTDTAIVSESSTASVISAVLVSTNTVFIAHNQPSYLYLYGIVVTIDDMTITAGTNTRIISTRYAGSIISAITLSDNKVLIGHCNSTGSSGHLTITICTISGTTISAGTSTEVSSTAYTCNVISIAKINTNKVFIAHSYGSDYYLYGMVVSISGTTVTAGTDTPISTTAKSGVYNSLCLLQDGNIFIVHPMTSYVLYGIVCTVSGTTITKGTDTQLNSLTANHRMKAVALKDNKVFIAHNNGNNATDYYLNGMIISINGMAITVGSDTALNLSVLAGREILPLLLDNGTIFIAHSYSSSYHLYAQIFGINEANNIPTNNVTIVEYETQVRKTTTSKFDGVAKEIVLGGEVPVLKQGDIIPKTWTAVTTGTEYVAGDGTKLTADSRYNDAGYALYACDGNTKNYWWSASGTGVNWIKLEFPDFTKITKMKTYITVEGGNFNYATIEGSENGTTWKILHTVSAKQTALTEIELENTNYYKFYRIVVQKTSPSYGAMIYEWQTSEYETVEQGKDLVSIYTLDTNFITRDGNAIMTADKNTFITKQ
jgi:hypothetical protein